MIFSYNKTGGPNNNGGECPVFCEIKDCGPDHKFCEKGMDMNGCRMPGWCKYVKSKA